MIQIQQVRNLSEQEILNLILAQNNSPLEIYVPKETQQFFSEAFEISIDYANLAYAGHLLHSASTDFYYEKVPPENHESVLFKVKTNDAEKLAEVLLQISYGYVSDHPDEEFIYPEFVEEYIDKAINGNIIVACPYFIEVYNEFLIDEE